MKSVILYPFGGTRALPVAVQRLQKSGVEIAQKPSPVVTHLLLPVPSFDADGTVRGGGALEEVLKLLPTNITVLGGNLTHPGLDGYEKIDLLQDVRYIAENAALTAQCALRLLLNLLPTSLEGLPVLVIGWGRIGKCLGKSLQLLGARVTVAARKEADRAMLRALGYGALATEEIPGTLSGFRVLFNTAPTRILSRSELEFCRSDCIKIDLASVCGLDGTDVIWARGLPGKDLPEASGLLIADTALRFLRRE